MDFIDLYKNDIFANELGITLQELNEEHSLMTLKVEKRHLNGGNVTHGGVLFTLTDIAMAAMANFNRLGSLSIQSDIRFLSSSIEGDTLTAEATAVYVRKNLNNCKVTITNQDGELIAIAEGMFYVKKSVISK